MGGATQSIDRSFVISLFCGVVMLLVACMPDSSTAASYLEHPEAAAFVDEMVERHGFERAPLEQLFAEAERKESILEAISRPAERKLTWGEYRKIFITSKRIKGGKAFMAEHAEVLQRAAATYGVPPEVIVAIIGVETRYGGNMGSYRVIDALSTLGFDYPPRSEFFRSELEQFLLLSREQGLDPASLLGSYAGAMGYGQFIPSSYQNFAVDFDGDGVIDIWNNTTDAIGSVANYFSEHHWKTGQPVVSSAHAEGTDYQAVLATSLKPAHTVGELERHGVRPALDLAPEESATLMELEGEKGPELWVGLENFYVITRYNHSKLYAMAVFQLSQAIGG